jgi:type II secretory pathway component PulC
MRQLVIRAINAAFFASSCFLAANMGNQWVAHSLSRPAPPAAQAAAPEAIANTAWDARQPILDRNLFGAMLEGGEEPDLEVVEDVEETKLPLTLLATIAPSEAGGEYSRAAIYDERARLEEVVRPGDALENHPNVKIDRIERGRVLLVNSGRREELLLAEDGGPSPIAAPAVPDRGTRRPSRRAASAAAAAQRAQAAAARTPSSDTRERMSELSERLIGGDLSVEEVQAEIERLNAAD